MTETETIQIPLEFVNENQAAMKEVQAGLTGLQSSVTAFAEKQISMKDTFKRSWTEISSAIGLARQGFQTVKRAIDETVGAYVEYADQVRTISMVTGQQADEVSRLIQVSDDYKVSTETLTMAMRKMATEGNELTIDSLARMSDEYLKLAPGVERQTYLTEQFGRAGLEFAEIMLQGSDAIRAQSDAISENLVLTNEEVVAAREYEIQLDNVSDSVEGLKIALGVELLPVLVVILEKVNEGIAAWQGMIGQVATFLALMDKAAPWVGGATHGLDALTSGLLGGAMTSGRTSTTLPATTPVASSDIAPSSSPYRGGGVVKSEASGGSFSGWAMVGDSPGGGRTPYTEYVYAPHGAVVYNQAQMSGRSAPPMANGGAISPMGEMRLSYETIQQLASAIGREIGVLNG